MSKINKILKPNLIISSAFAAVIIIGAVSFVSFSNADDKKVESATVAANNVAFTSIAVIDMQQIFDKSLAAGKAREQIENKAEALKKDSDKKEAYFKKKLEEIEKQKTVLSKEAFEQKGDELSKEFSEVQKKVQEERGNFERAQAEVQMQVEATISEIVKDEANKSGYKLVLHKGQTVYADDALDITLKVLEAFNKKLPSVTLKF